MWYVLKVCSSFGKESCLEESIDLAGLGVDVDVEVARSGGETGDGLDVGGESVSARFISDSIHVSWGGGHV